MSTEEIIKELNYIAGVHPKFVREEIETLINKLKDKS